MSETLVGNNDIDAQLRAFIRDQLMYHGDVSALGVEESLIDAGVIDSTGVLELVEFLETNFRISVSDEEIVPENLGSLAGIARFISCKR